MSRKRKEQKIQKIAKLYLLSFLDKALMSSSYIYSQKLISFISSVEFAYASLSAPLKKIINNDFFYQAYPGWWKLIYKKNNYQRLKDLAMDEFLEAFNEI